MPALDLVAAGNYPWVYDPMRLSARLLVTLMAPLGAAVGCAEPTLDSSSWRQSTAKVRATVEESRQDDFDLAVSRVRRASEGEVDGTEPFSVDGMTAEAVFREAERIELRSDLVWTERAIETEREIIEARAELDRLKVIGFSTWRDDRDRIRASFEVENSLESAVVTAWLRIEAQREVGGTLAGEDLVDFRPALPPGARREIEIVVTSEANRALPPGAGAAVTARFTLIEGGGDILAQEPTPEALEVSRGRLAEAERHRDDLRAKLDGPG